MQIATVAREQVIELASAMPIAKLAQWYEYGLLIQSSPLLVSVEDDKARLKQEFAAWEAASDEDWQVIESKLTEVA